MKSPRHRSRKIRRTMSDALRRHIGPLGPFDRLTWNLSRGKWASWGLWLEWSVRRRPVNGIVCNDSGSACVGR